MKILIVDDEALIREDYKSIAMAYGHSVMVASSQFGAKVILQMENFDLIILDKDLPYIDVGLSLVQLAREFSPESNIWLISGRMDEDVKMKAIELGANSAFCKPLEFHTAFMEQVSLQKVM